MPTTPRRHWSESSRRRLPILRHLRRGSHRTLYRRVEAKLEGDFTLKLPRSSLFAAPAAGCAPSAHDYEGRASGTLVRSPGCRTICRSPTAIEIASAPLGSL